MNHQPPPELSRTLERMASELRLLIASPSVQDVTRDAARWRALEAAVNEQAAGGRP